MSKRIHQLPPAGSLDPAGVFMLEHPAGSTASKKQTISSILDFVVSIGRLQVKEPVDMVVNSHVPQLDVFDGEDGKRYALNAQMDSTQNGIYLCTSGALTILPNTSYFDSYGPGSLFMDLVNGKLWFIPISKATSNVTDPESGIRPQAPFNFQELSRSMLDLSVLDKWETCGELIFSGYPGSSVQFTGAASRNLPLPIFDNYTSYAQAFSIDLTTERSPLVYSKISSTGSSLVFLLMPLSITGNEDDNCKYFFHGRVSDAFLLDQIEINLTPLPGSGYYYSLGG